jgi:hypothetical protein
MIESVEMSNRKQTSSAPVVNDEFTLPEVPKKAAAPTSLPPVETTSNSGLDDLEDFDSNSFDDELYASL